MLSHINSLLGSGRRPPSSTAPSTQGAPSWEFSFAEAAEHSAAGRRTEAQQLLQSIPSLGEDRATRTTLALRAAALDGDFLKLVSEGDRARDRADWKVAEYTYYRALELYPLHWGYRIQYAHALKDQGKIGAAELHYRTVAAQGAPEPQYREHLAFVCARQGVAPGLPPMAVAPSALLEPPTIMDVRALTYLLLHEATLGLEDELSLMRAANTCEAVALALIQDARFADRNRLFLDILRTAHD